MKIESLKYLNGCRVEFLYNGKIVKGTVSSMKQSAENVLLMVTLYDGQRKTYRYDRTDKLAIVWNPQWNRRRYVSTYNGTGEPYDAWKDSQLVKYGI